jgi:hypothetical protein
MSLRIKITALARALGVPAGLIAIAWVTLLAGDVVRRHTVMLSDVRDAHDAAMRAGENSIADVLSNAAERTLAASSAAGHVVRLLVGISLFGAVAFLLFGAASRPIRIGTLICVLLLFLSVGFQPVD